MTPTSSSLRALVLFLAFACLPSFGQSGLNLEQIAFRRDAAAAAVFKGSGTILSCLGMAKAGAGTEGMLDRATQELKAALAPLREISATPFTKQDILYGSKTTASQTELYSDFQNLLFKSKIQVKLKLQRDIAEGYLQAVERMMEKIIGKNCAALVKNRNSLVELLEAKILLERASQVAEIEWPAQ